MSRFLDAYQTYFSKATDAPLEFGHASGLMCLSTIALGRRWIARGSGIRPNIYMLLVADSSKDRKSTAVKMAANMLRTVEPERVGPKDFTAEGLVFLMRAKKSGKSRNKLLLPMEEFGSYLSATGAYSKTLSTTLCDLYDGDDYERVRSGKKALRVEKPRISLFSGCAYGMLEKYADPQDWVTGFFARFLFVTPFNRPPRFASQPVNPVAEFNQAAMQLADLRNILKANSGPMPTDPQADQLHTQYATNFPDQTDPLLAAQKERLLNTTWKLATLYQIDENPMAPVGPLAMNKAIQATQTCWLGVQRVYGATAGSTYSRTVKRIWKAISATGDVGIPRSTLLKNFKLSSDNFQNVIELLLKNQAIAVHKISTGGRGPPTEILVALDTYTDHD